jgi:hypothetical protein
LESGLDQDFHLPPMSLALESRVVVSDEQVHTSLGDEAVILGLGDGVYYGLDAVGAACAASTTSWRCAASSPIAG